MRVEIAYLTFPCACWETFTRAPPSCSLGLPLTLLGCLLVGLFLVFIIILTLLATADLRASGETWANCSAMGKLAFRVMVCTLGLGLGRAAAAAITITRSAHSVDY